MFRITLFSISLSFMLNGCVSVGQNLYDNAARKNCREQYSQQYAECIANVERNSQTKRHERHQ